MSIYQHTAGDRTPYTYLIGWTNLDVWYYGRRTKIGCHPNDLFNPYQTSSESVKSFIKEHGLPNLIQVRRIFHSVKKCRLWESKFLRRTDCAHNPVFLNRKNGDDMWDTTNQTTVKDIEGNTLLVDTNDPRYLSGELIHFQKGVPKSPDHVKKVAESRKKNKKPLSDESRERFRTASLNREILICPHCGKESNDHGNMRRWHFDKCPLIASPLERCSSETRQSLSISIREQKRQNLSVRPPCSKITKEKISDTKLRKRFHWYTNGIVNMSLSEQEKIPDGFRRGKVLSQLQTSS